MAKTLTTTSIAVTINGQDYSKYFMFPFKVSNLLDEQLDEASLTLIGVPEKNFKPLTDAIVTLTNGNKIQSYSMLVASDKADEIPTGSGKYKHELYLIEQTKYLECFIVRSIGFVNPLEKEYAQVKVTLDTIDKSYSGGTSYSDVYGTIDKESVKYTPIYANQKYAVPSPSLLILDWAFEKFPYTSGYYTYNYVSYGETIINNNGEETVYTEDLWNQSVQYFTPKSGFVIVTIKATVLTYNVDVPPDVGVTPPTDFTIWKDRVSITCRYNAVVI